MKNLFFIISYINSLTTKLDQNISPIDYCLYKNYLFNYFNPEKEICDNMNISIDKIEKKKSSDHIIYIGIFSLIKEMNTYKLNISGCSTKKIIKSKLKFELSIKNIKNKIVCTIDKLNSTEIKNFDINCKIKRSEYSIMMEGIILNDVPTLKGFAFKGFERYIPRGSRKK